MGNVQDGETDENKESHAITYEFLDRQKTFNIRNSSRVQRGFTLKANILSTLSGAVNMRLAVKLRDEDDDVNEWLALNTFLFYEVAVNLQQTLQEFCTDESCPLMTAGKNAVYLWADGKKVKKPIEVSAPEYCAYLLEWIYDQITDPDLFPQDDDTDFPKNFQRNIKKIYKRLFRLYAHIFHSHYAHFNEAGMEAHLNSCFKHLSYFILEFDLVTENERKPLQDLMDKMIERDMQKFGE